jgi:hypothetical protein
MYLKKPKRPITLQYIWNNPIFHQLQKNKISRGSYKENFCWTWTFPERSSIPPGKTCFVPLLSGKKKSNRQAKIRENYWISYPRAGSFYLSWTMLHNKTSKQALGVLKTSPRKHIYNLVDISSLEIQLPFWILNIIMEIKNKTTSFVNFLCYENIWDAYECQPSSTHHRITSLQLWIVYLTKMDGSTRRWENPKKLQQSA